MHSIDQPLTWGGHPDQAEPETDMDALAITVREPEAAWMDRVPLLLLDFVEGEG